MPRVLVIADDLTGAAEIAGIASRFGLDTQLLRAQTPPPTACDCVVYDTNTRLLRRNDAVQITRSYAEAARAGTFDWVFKKTDSVLRGEPLAEVNAVADVFRRGRVLFVPHNPSRGRCIVGGVYLVHGQRLDQTEFADDPLHPATSAEAIALLRPTAADVLSTHAPGGQPTRGVVIGEASTLAEVDEWANEFDPAQDLAAGGADFFEALCRRFTTVRPPAIEAPLLPRPLLIVSGTASPATAAFRARLSRDGQLSRMPDDLFHDTADATTLLGWAKDAVIPLQQSGVAMMAIDRAGACAPGRAEYLGCTLVGAAARAAQVGQVRTVACEGGATAAAWCDFVGWRRFRVDGELAPGVVALRLYGANDMRFVLKPGSYPWPTL